MSFLDESDFDGPRSQNKNNSRPINNDYEDEDLSNQFGNRVNLCTPSGSRARMLAQEREKQLKRRQNSAQNEGMIRSSLSPAPKSQGQFTPAIRQFSAPKNVKGNFDDDDDDNGNDENIDRLASSATRGKPPPRGKNNQKGGGGYDDDDDDNDDDRYNQRRDNNNAKLKVVNRQYGDDEDDDYNNNKKNNQNNNGGTKSDKMAAQIAAHHTRVMKFASDANESSNSFNNNNNRSNNNSNNNQSQSRQQSYNKGSYRDEEDDDDDNNNNNDYDNNNNNKNQNNTRYVAPPSQAPPLGKRSNNNNSRNNNDNDGETDNWAASKNNQNNNNRNQNINNNNNNNNSSNNRNSNNNNNSYNQNNSHHQQNNHSNNDDDEDDDDDDDDDEEESGHGTKNTLSSDTLKNQQAQQIVPLDLSDMREFLMSPVSRGSGIVQCYIKRNKVGVNKLFPVYSLYLKEPNRFLMASKKRPNNKTSNYLISMNEGDLSRDGSNYLGKLRSNFVGTEFQIFDNGINPKEDGGGGGSNSNNHHDHNNEVRKEMGAVIYAANVLGSRGPRKMQVAIPAVDENNNSSAFHQSLSLARSSSLALTANTSFSNRPGSATPKRRSSFSRFVTGVTGGGSGGDSASGGDSLSNGEDILARIKDKNFKDLGYFINKPPRWNDQVGAYVLNFNGRVTMASVKNFQLVDPDEINDVTLQFGRVGKDDFTMDLQWPMSPFQAFAITLSSFDSKIACD